MGRVRIEKPTDERLKELGVDSWNTWECDVKKFDWKYDEDETFYVLEGDAEVITQDGENAQFGKGDLVTFPKGVSCVWDVKKRIKKLYKFG